MSEDYYSLLGLPRNASKTDIKKSYRRLAHKWHPDKNLNNQIQSKKMFCRISEAYSTLIEDGKRMAYDRKCKVSKENHRKTTDNANSSRRDSSNSDFGRKSFVFHSNGIRFVIDNRSTVTTSHYRNGVKYTSIRTTEFGRETVKKYENGRLVAKTINGVSQPIPG